MPFVLLIIGELLVITGIQGTQSEFYSLLEGDFSGNNSFIYWLLAIALIGGLGYVPGFKTFSNAFLLLILVVLLLSQSKNNPKGFFQNISTALQSSTTAPALSANITPVSGNSDNSGILNQASQALNTAATAAAIFA